VATRLFAGLFPVLHTRAPTWKVFGPAVTSLLSRPIVPHEAGLMVRTADACVIPATEKADAVAIPSINANVRASSFLPRPGPDIAWIIFGLVFIIALHKCIRTALQCGTVSLLLEVVRQSSAPIDMRYCKRKIRLVQAELSLIRRMTAIHNIAGYCRLTQCRLRRLTNVSKAQQYTRSTIRPLEVSITIY
jgi:hypothetical protein